MAIIKILVLLPLIFCNSFIIILFWSFYALAYLFFWGWGVYFASFLSYSIILSSKSQMSHSALSLSWLWVGSPNEAYLGNKTTWGKLKLKQRFHFLSLNKRNSVFIYISKRDVFRWYCTTYIWVMILTFLSFHTFTLSFGWKQRSAPDKNISLKVMRANQKCKVAAWAKKMSLPAFSLQSTSCYFVTLISSCLLMSYCYIKLYCIVRFIFKFFFIHIQACVNCI